MQGRRMLLAAAVAAAVFSSAATAKADPPAIVVANGETQEAFDYAGAVRDRVWVDSDFDSDADGLADKIAVDIIRPAATNDGLEGARDHGRQPVLLDARPRQRVAAEGRRRGRAAVEVAALPRQLLRPARVRDRARGHDRHQPLDGLPDGSGPTDNNAAVDVIDWFKGRRTAHDKDGNLVPAPPWFNGKTGMIGKSYDGALAAAAAVTGVDGLTTIVGESGPYRLLRLHALQRRHPARRPLRLVAREHGHRRQPPRVTASRCAIRSTRTTPTPPATSRRRSGTTATTSRTRRRSAPACS